MAFGGFLGQTVEDTVSGAYNTASNLASTLEDVARIGGSYIDDLRRGDIQGMSDQMAAFEDEGTDAFGTGGWYKAAFNMATGGSPYGAKGDMLAKAIEGEDIKRSDYARLASEQLPSYDTGYGKTVNSAVNSGIKGATTAALSGEDVAKGFGQGAVQGGTMSTLGDYFNNMGKDYGSFKMPDMNADSLPNYFDNYAGGPVEGMPSFDMSQPQQQGYWDQLKANPWFKGTMGFLSAAHPVFGAINNQVYGKPAQQQARMPDTDSYAQTLRDIGIDPAEQRGSGPVKQDPYLQVGQVLGSMYNTGKAQRRLDDLTKQMDVSRGAYRTQMQKELVAQDAARGRRSQYGNRSVELQAKLASLDAQRMPTLQRMYEGQDTLNNRQLINALRLYETGRQPATEMYDSLKGMWNGNG